MIQIPWWVYPGIGVIAVVLYYQVRAEGRGGRTVIFVATMVGILATLIELQSAAFQNRREVEHRRLEAAFEYATRLEERHESENFARVSNLVDAIRGKPDTSIHRLLATDTVQWYALQAVLNVFEEIGVAVEVGYVDSGTLCAMYGEFVLDVYRALEGWLEYYRVNKPDPTAWQYYDELYNAWHRGCPSKTDLH